MIGDHAQMARNRRDLGARGRLLRLDLVAHGGDGRRIGPNENDAGLGERLGEGGPLREEAVAGMHRLRAALLARGDDLLDDQVALRRRRRADGNGRIGHFHMQGVAIRVGIDRDGFNTHAARGFDNPAGDLAAVGNQDSLEHFAE